MERKNVFCCSCFADQAVWFIENAFYSWQFDPFLYTNGVISDKVFVYEKFFEINANANIEYKTSIIVCCVECFEFMLRFLSGKEEIICLLNELDCRYVYQDVFCFNLTIYTGNDCFQLDARNNHSMSTREQLEKYFVKFPETKSCFTSLDRYYYKYFCYNCKKFFTRFFLKSLYLFKNDVNCRCRIDLATLR